MAGLAYKAILYFRTVADARPFTDDRVLANNACTDIHICMRRTKNGTIAKPACPRNLAVVVYDSVRYLLRVHYLYVISNGANGRCKACNLFRNQSANSILKVFILKVFHHKGSKLTAKFGEHNDVSVSRLIQYRYNIALPVGCAFGCFHYRNVGNQTIVTYRVIVNVVPNLLYQAVVAYGYVS